MDLVLVILPKIEPDAPTTGPALLKACVVDAGYSAKLLDFNIELFRALEKNNDQSHYDFNDMKREEHFFNTVLETQYSWLIDSWIEKIISLNPKFVGFSLLTQYSVIYAIKLSEHIKRIAPHIKIVWGGAGASYNIQEDLIKRKIIDYFILGDGEINVVNLLKGDINHKGINTSTENKTSMQIDDLNSMLTPDYSDIDWTLYRPKYGIDTDAVYITGSRGCVKSCDFCNVWELWPKYRFRSAEHIMKEVEYVVLKLGRTNIKFTDSLINGSMKEFRKLLLLMVELKKKVPEFRWTSQWIVRSESQSPEEDYRLMAESGCYKLDIGVESFSERVRFEMGKKFTDVDMWFCFDMIRKYKMWGALLMFVGYPTETDKDHELTLQSIEKIITQGYGHYITFSFSSSLMMHPNDKVYLKHKDNLEFIEGPYQWSYKDNTLQKRYERMKQIYELGNLLSRLHLNNRPLDHDYMNAIHHIKTLENYNMVKPVLHNISKVVPSSRIELL